MVGLAAGAGMFLLATVATAAHLLVIVGFPTVERYLPRTRWTPSLVRCTYADRAGILREVLTHITDRNFTIAASTSIGRAPQPVTCRCRCRSTAAGPSPT
jgi:putative Mg2+ transporter-C (MgtC) family protein